MFLLKQTTHRMLIRHDEAIGHLFVPNLKVRLPNERGGYLVKTNAQGFRSDTEFTNKKAEDKRILFFGDSFIVGDHCDNNQRFSDLCGQLLNAETYNYGLSGSGTGQQLLIYEKFANQVEADVIVIGVMVENIDRISLDSRPSIDRTTGKLVAVPKPFFQLDGDDLVLKNTPVPTQREPIQTDEKNASSLVSRIVTEANQLTKKYTGANHSKLRTGLVKLSGYTPQPQYKDHNHPDLRLMRVLLQRFIEQAQKQAQVILLPIPTPHYLIDGVKPYYQDFFNTFENPEKNVWVYDITSDLLPLPWEVRERMNYDIDNHFSPEGHEIISKLLSDYIQKKIPSFKKTQSSPDLNRKQKQQSDQYTLGISCFYHNAGAALLKNGQIVAAAEEERFTRVKNDKGFPAHAINYCLEAAGIHQQDLDAVVYYDNYDLTFERILSTIADLKMEGQEVWQKIMPSWLGYKLHIPDVIRKEMHYEGLILKNQHHRSHAASAYYPSPYESAAVLTIDGVGEWATATIGKAKGDELELIKEMHFPHSLGLLYSAFTQFTGFKVNSGEYKMMGLAPYGQPRFVDAILQHLVTIKEDGSILLNMEYFDFLHGKGMANEKWAELFEGPALPPNSRITRREFDIARSAQVVTEMVIIKMAQHAYELTQEKNLCMAGGVALNCVANGKILQETPFENIWIQPAAGDSGCALGAAFDAYVNYFGNARQPQPSPPQKGSYWGPGFSTDEVTSFLDTFKYPYQELEEKELLDEISKQLIAGKVVGHMAGRCEYGPRALGNRSILGDARNTSMQSTLNLKIKFRESFRPFAPSVLEEDAREYFELQGESPYMLLVAPVNTERCIAVAEKDTEDLLSIVNEARSDVPAITHVDYSARIQTVKQDFNPRYHKLISSFKEKTGYGLVVNTSFNVRGEPIVLSPYDAYRCFMRTNMDVLVMENCILYKEQQPEWPEELGQGLEDIVHQTKSSDKKLERSLDQFFTDVLLPALQSLPSEALLGEPGAETIESGWTSAPKGAVQRSDFEVNVALSEVDKDLFHVALSKDWKNKDLVQVFHGIGPQFTALMQKHKITVIEKEMVEDNIYVMF